MHRSWRPPLSHDRPVPPPQPHDLSDAAHLQLLVEQIRDFAIVMLTPDGRHATWNPGVKRVLGYDEAEFVGQPAEIIFTPEDVAAGIPAGELATAREHGSASDDRWMRRRDGTRFWASGVTTAVRDATGRVVGYGKVLRDLTEQRTLLERLAASEARLRLAIGAARIATWRWDLRTGGDSIDANLARLLGLGDSDRVVTLDEFFDAVHPDDRERTRAAFLDAVARREGLETEFRIVTADGGIRWLRDYGEVITDDAGEPRWLTGAVVDITAQREAEQRLRVSERMDAVSKLAGGVAHEVNNMMSVVLGFTDFVLAGLPPGDRRRLDLEQVRMAAGRAATVTAQLLAFSRQQVLRPAVLRLDEVVSALEPALRRLLGDGRELVLRVLPGSEPVFADRGQLEQVLMNLALNARDAMPEDGRLTIETGRAPDGSAVLAVSDTGHGMDEETRARIFEPFFTTRPTGQGTGLGLAVVHGIVHQSGGRIGVESAPGAGTTFRIFLPPVSETAIGPRRPSPPPPAGAGGETILVVEDEPLVRQLVVRMLGELGYRCLEAGDGTEALQLLDEFDGPVHGVVTDLVMPRMNGRQLAARLAAVRPELPLLFMSGYTDDDMIRRDLLVRDAPFIQKPFGIKALATRLRAMLRTAGGG